MIFTECCYCDEEIVYGYEAGDIGAGGFVKYQCENCGKNNFIELVSFAGSTYSEEAFWEKYPEAKKMFD